MQTDTTTRRLIAAAADLVVTDLQRAFRDDLGRPTSNGRLVPSRIRAHLNGHTITISYNGCRADSLLDYAHVKRSSEQADAMSDYFPGCFTNLKGAIALATGNRG